MKKIISFSLYGNDQILRYCHGMISNATLAKIIYPDWIVRVYYGNSVPKEIIDILRTYDNVELIHMDIEENDYSRMWRFLAISDDDVEIMLSRDADSRLSYREKIAVDIFIESDYLLHSIRDNRNHQDIMGGMWGIKKNTRINMKELVDSYNGLLYYHTDQDFLRQILLPHFQDSCLTHCSFYLKNYPHKPEKNLENFFVGQVFLDGKNEGMGYDHMYF